MMAFAGNAVAIHASSGKGHAANWMLWGLAGLSIVGGGASVLCLLSLPGINADKWSAALINGLIPLMIGWFGLLLNSPAINPRGSRRGMKIFWRILLIGVHLFFLFVASRVAGGWFFRHFAFLPGEYPVPVRWLTLSLFSNALAGGVLLGVAIWGLLLLLFSSPRLKGRSGDLSVTVSAVQRVGSLLWLAVALRLTALVASFGIGFTFEPLGPNFFIESVKSVAGLELTVRLGVGVLLPGLIAWQLMTVNEFARHIFFYHWVLVVVLILVGEILGAGLTFGMLGLAF